MYHQNFSLPSIFENSNVKFFLIKQKISHKILRKFFRGEGSEEVGIRPKFYYWFYKRIDMRQGNRQFLLS